MARSPKSKTPIPAPDVSLFLSRSGPRKGPAECEAAFRTKAEAVAFLTDLHGLTGEESRRLAREMALSLKRKWHGAERCAIREERMSPEQARRALSGELFLAAA